MSTPGATLNEVSKPSADLSKFVHKVQPGACLVRQWAQTGVDEFLVEVDWAGGRESETRDNTVDLLLVGETIRQTALLIPHVAYGVPVGWSFSMSALCARRTSYEPSNPDMVKGTVYCRNAISRGGNLSAMSVHVTFTDQDRILARGVGRLRVLPPDVYARLRPSAQTLAYRSPLPRVHHEQSGRRKSADVLLGFDEHGALRLAVDTSHPGYFDHPVDHVPGMVAIEAARQAFFCRRGSEPSAFAARFYRYLELSQDPHFAFPYGTKSTAIAFTQRGHHAADVVLR